MNASPVEAHVVITEKGKTKEAYLELKQTNSGYMLEVMDTPHSRWKRRQIPIRRSVVEMKNSDKTGKTVLLVTNDSEILLVFDNPEEARGYTSFIIDKSDVHAENKAIERLDEEISRIWPFPGGSYF